MTSFGRRRAEEPEPAVLPPIQLPPVRLLLEVDRDMLLTLGDQIRDTVYNAAIAGLQAAVEDFSASPAGVDEDPAEAPAGDVAP